MLLDPKIPKKLAVLDGVYDRLRFTPIGALDIEMAETMAHIRGVPTEADGLAWRKVESGATWGENWSTAWLRGTVRVPDDWAGGPLFLRAQTGAHETMLLIDGKHRGVFDENHPVRLLTLDAVAGARRGAAGPGRRPPPPPLGPRLGSTPAPQTSGSRCSS